MLPTRVFCGGVGCSFPCSRALGKGLALGCAGLKSTQAPLISTQGGTSTFDFLF